MCEDDKGLYCTECFNYTPKFYCVVLDENEVDFGLCFRCANEILHTLPVDATIREELPT